MRKLFIIPVLAGLYCIGFTASPPRSIQIKLIEDKSYFFDEKYRDTAINAFRIMTAIYSSQEFQDSVSKIDFKCKSFAAGCNRIELTNGRIEGKTVLNLLFKRNVANIKLILKENGGALGETYVNTDTTNTYFNPIRDDMKTIPFTYALAVNLCHEYMHSIGFQHLYCSGFFCLNHLSEHGDDPDPKFINDDVTYRVGWIAYRIMQRKYKNHEGAF
jgi:hypothetical protein